VGEFFFGIDCNSEVVSVYSGSWDYPRESVSVWNSQPTVPPTAYPTKAPTTALPTALFTAVPTVAMTSSPPVPISLELGGDSTSSAAAEPAFVTIFAMLLILLKWVIM
jgi:hypothetical protein